MSTRSQMFQLDCKFHKIRHHRPTSAYCKAENYLVRKILTDFNFPSNFSAVKEKNFDQQSNFYAVKIFRFTVYPWSQSNRVFKPKTQAYFICCQNHRLSFSPDPA